MALSFSFIFKKISTAIIIIVAIVYLAGSLTPYINPINFNCYTYIALVFPYLLLAMLACCIVSFFVVKKYTWLFFLLIFIGYKNIFSTTALHFTKIFLQDKKPNTFRLLSWNVNDFVDNQVQSDKADAPRRKILDFIKKSDADVLCFQDYRDYPEGVGYYSSAKYIKDTLHYPYYYFSVDMFYNTSPSKESYGTAIFSKFPIVDTGRTRYDWPDYPEHLNYADVKFPTKTIRFYNTHLRSMHLNSERKSNGWDYTFVQDDTSILFNKTKFETIAYFDSIHIRQAQLIKQQLTACKRPFVFCADLNSVPSSYVYQHISKGLNDAFLQNGFGWGATYDGLSPTLRIDVALLHPQLKATQYYCPKLKASDHFPLLIDIAFP